MTATGVSDDKTKLFKLDTPEFRADPYPTLARFRQMAGLPRVQMPFFHRAGWMVTRYDEVVSVLKDSRFSVDPHSLGDGAKFMDARWLPRSFRVLQNNMLSQDDPKHARLRGLVHQAFTPRMIEKMSGRIEQIANDLLDQAARERNVDLVARFALPIPLIIISEMMGVPEQDRLRFHRWSGRFLESPPAGLWSMLANMPTVHQMLGFFDGLLRSRRLNPRDDLLTALVQAEQAGDRLNEDELVSMVFLLLLAGHETTVNLIGNGTLALLQHPDQLRRLHDHPELIETAVEELLRFTNPVEHGTSRIATEPVELAGQVIPKGEGVLAMLSAANRDETQFPDPDRLDIARQPNRHVAFGLGIHYCLGAPLARLEGRIAIQALVRRFPELQLAVAPDRVRWRSTMAVRGVRELPVKFPDLAAA